MTKRRYPELPVLSAGAIIFKNDEVLLIKRGQEPARGLWSIPGGVIKVGEKILDGLNREIMEETGIEVIFGSLIDVIERIFYDDDKKVEYHYIILDYAAEFKRGVITAASDVDEARFVPVEQIENFALTEGMAEVIFRACKLRTGIHVTQGR